MTVYPYINYGLNPMICGFIRFHMASWHGIVINHQPAWRSSWRSPLSSWLLSPPHKSHGFWLVSTLKQWGSPSCIYYIYRIKPPTSVDFLWADCGPRKLVNQDRIKVDIGRLKCQQEWWFEQKISEISEYPMYNKIYKIWAKHGYTIKYMWTWLNDGHREIYWIISLIKIWRSHGRFGKLPSSVVNHSTSTPPEKILPCSAFPWNFLPVGAWWSLVNIGKKRPGWIWKSSHLLHRTNHLSAFPKSQALQLKKWFLVLCSICYPQVFTHGKGSYRWLLISICQTCVFLHFQVDCRKVSSHVCWKRVPNYFGKSCLFHFLGARILYETSSKRVIFSTVLCCCLWLTWVYLNLGFV